MRFMLGAILSIGLAAGAAQATDKNGSFKILGAGTVTCDYYLKASPEERLHAETWWAGYRDKVEASARRAGEMT